MERNDDPAPQFAFCVDNSGYPASLEVFKLYQILRDDGAAGEGELRVVDDSGEDYLYSARRFVPIALPKAAVERVRAAMKNSLR